MKEEEELLCSYMADFFEKNFEKITCDLSRLGIPTQKKKFIDEILKEPETTFWALNELVKWGMDKEYLKEIYVELPFECDFKVLKIGDKYLKMTYNNKTCTYYLNFSERKTMIVFYYD